MYMENKNLGGKHWAELDFKVASDYTHGSPEYYRSLLRKLTGMPKLLPGEKSEISKSANNNQRTFNRKSSKGNMSDIFYQG